ncbi:Protein STE50 [Nakaseomyces glabratus]|uniref:Protein STE50 n=1 Tax=Candida glabrata TaxID=5478 RepID=A0A0W0DYH5_CANGB|nr:Ras-associating (RA) domain profile [Nakaseomyces glabratus]KAH7591567.1 Ras-associating (RA) domain profile [Nakaseomyces glabratus]KAH7598160.1 Ras-associating (RA) domain profile [Nakaseomyces glabratus]KAH7608792.1 Ras-associating (RA) domain profile [Nakaseomyces glabratus]KAH7615159.1 Ras-associating (RA) domain profile [Nakaseomyces glabratus]
MDDSQKTLRQGTLLKDNFDKWTTDEVVQWCGTVLGKDEQDPLFTRIRDNNIDGSVLQELTLQDCKELTDNDLKEAIKLKLWLNKLIDSQLGEDDVPTEDIVVVLKNLHTTVSQKLLDFQSQYSGLRADVVEIMKRSKTAEHGMSSPQLTPSTASSKPSGARTDYFDHGQLRQSPRAKEVRPTLLYNKSTPNSNSNSNSKYHDQIIHANSSLTIPNIKSNLSPIEPLKQLKASKEDSCEKILKNAMVRHNLADQDWKQYVLVISYGDQERILDLAEKPVVIFKNLKRQGLHPSIMLRRRGDFEEVDMSMNGLSSADVTPGGRL